jgi:hypothetical protein
MTDALRFPTGKFTRPPSYDPATRATYIDAIARTPADLRSAVTGLSSSQLDEPYRPGGWTLRQVVHHVPDSHMNAYVRFKLALTEDAPVIKPYDEARWAELEDSRTTPIETSLQLLDAIHDRWVRILRAMSPSDYAREYTHPEMGRNPLDFMLALYAWHGPHHIAHISALRERKGW